MLPRKTPLPLDLWGKCSDPKVSLQDPVLHGLTDEQQEIVQRPFPGTESSLVVQAYAGTGKTHTLHAFAKARPNEKIHYLAFNKSMADEAASKFRGMKNVRVSTIHSLAYQEIGKKFRERLGDIQLTQLSPLIGKYFPYAAYYKAGYALKNWLEAFLSSSEKTTGKFFARHCTARHQRHLSDDDIDADALADAVEELWLNIVKGEGPCEGLTMPHNAYLKLYQIAGRQMKSRFVLIDEAQDVTDCMISIVSEQKAHRIFIGDSFQQIYAWNGAVDSLRKLEKAGADSLFLTRSFRCPDHVADMANRYLTLLGAKKPFRGNGKTDFKPSQPCILARSNAALFKEAWNCVRNGEKLSFLGGFDGYGFSILLDLQYALYEKFEKIHDPWLKEEFNTFDEILEYAETADQHLLSRCNIVRQYRSKIRSMYVEIKKAQALNANSADVVFSTTHKAKGAEWGEVYLCDDFVSIAKLNNDACTSEKPVTVRREDLNILYVAITRSKGKIDIYPEFQLSDGEILRFQENIRNGKILLVD